MKQKVPMICNIVSLILLIVFVIKSIVDYTQCGRSGVEHHHGGGSQFIRSM